MNEWKEECGRNRKTLERRPILLHVGRISRHLGMDPVYRYEIGVTERLTGSESVMGTSF